MAYRYDNDLEFLNNIKSEDLSDLVYCLTHDKDGQARYTEALTASDAYKAHYPNHHKYWQSIASEVQCFGANSFTTIQRGGNGIKYKAILADVCDKMNVNCHQNVSIDSIEKNLLMKVLADAIDTMSMEELKALAQSVGVKNTNNINPDAMVGIFQATFRAGSIRSYQLTLVIVNALMKALIGKGLSFAGKAAYRETSSLLTVPINWVIISLWTAIDVTGPAYRVIIPAVVQVAVLRQKYLYEKQVKAVVVDNFKDPAAASVHLPELPEADTI